MGNGGAHSGKSHITIAARNPHAYSHTHSSNNNSNSNRLASPQDAIEACVKLIEDECSGCESVALRRARGVGRSYGSEEIAAATVDFDVAVGKRLKF